MKCILCYLSNECQQSLKKAAQTKSDRFEVSLCEYKTLFINGLKNLTSVCKCEEDHSSSLNDIMAKYLKDLQDDILSNKLELINSLFDEIIDIYESFIENNHIIAYDKLKNYIYKRCTRSSVDNPHGFCKPLFRVIPKPNQKWNYNIKDENAYFHIPFSKRFLVSNQRYSISGLPMCYLASNLQTALNEVGKSLNQVNVAAFLPKFSDFYTKIMFDATNRIVDTLRINIFETDSKHIYHSDYDFLSKRIDSLLADYVLFQVLQFPTKDDTKGSFIQEYVLPQLLMELIQNESSWIGVKYQSTKSIGSVFSIDDSQLYENYCFVVPYEKNDDYSSRFKDKFHIVLSSNSTMIPIETFKEQCQSFKVLCRKNQEQNYIMTDYNLYVHKIEMLISEDEKRVESGQISKEVWQMEIDMMSQLLRTVEKMVQDPDKYEVLKHSDYS